MPSPPRKSASSDLERVRRAFIGFRREHPEARVDVKRQNEVSIRVRVIDPGFRGMSLVERDDLLWKSIESLPEDVLSQITMLLAFTPDEARTSFANQEFESPIRSKL